MTLADAECARDARNWPTIRDPSLPPHQTALEEWHLLMQHYCLVFATVDRIAAAEDSAEENWVRRLGCHLEISQRAAAI